VAKTSSASGPFTHKNMKITYIRHAESVNNHSFYMHGNGEKYVLDPPLSELGEQQAAALADFLTANLEEFDFDRIYISPFLRTLQTAAAFSHLYPEIPKIVCPWIYEGGGCREIIRRDPLEVKISSGMGRSEILEKFPDFTVEEDIENPITDEGWYTLGKVEPESHVFYRAVETIEYFTKQHPYPEEHIALISHGNFFNHLVSAILEGRKQFRFYLGVENTSISQFSYHPYEENPRHPGFWRIEYMNRFEWLRGTDLLRDWSKFQNK
jgi:broad specificity phosphatase PhoE